MKVVGRLALSLFAVIPLGDIAVAQSFAVPTSDNVVSGKIGISSQVFGFKIREGAMLSVEQLGGGKRFGLVPIISGKNVSFAVFLIESSPRGGERLIQLMIGRKKEAELLIPTAGGSVVLSEMNLTLTVSGVSAGHFRMPSFSYVDGKVNKSREIQRMYGVSGGGLCVLSCGDITVGANSVSGKCGTCEGDFSVK